MTLEGFNVQLFDFACRSRLLEYVIGEERFNENFRQDIEALLSVVVASNSIDPVLCGKIAWEKFGKFLGPFPSIISSTYNSNIIEYYKHFAHSFVVYILGLWIFEEGPKYIKDNLLEISGDENIFLTYWTGISLAHEIGNEIDFDNVGDFISQYNRLLHLNDIHNRYYIQSLNDFCVHNVFDANNKIVQNINLFDGLKKHVGFPDLEMLECGNTNETYYRGILSALIFLKTWFCFIANKNEETSSFNQFFSDEEFIILHIAKNIFLHHIKPQIYAPITLNEEPFLYLLEICDSMHICNRAKNSFHYILPEQVIEVKNVSVNIDSDYIYLNFISNVDNDDLFTTKIEDSYLNLVNRMSSKLLGVNQYLAVSSRCNSGTSFFNLSKCNMDKQCKNKEAAEFCERCGMKYPRPLKMKSFYGHPPPFNVTCKITGKKECDILYKSKLLVSEYLNFKESKHLLGRLLNAIAILEKASIYGILDRNDTIFADFMNATVDLYSIGSDFKKQIIYSEHEMTRVDEAYALIMYFHNLDLEYYNAHNKLYGKLNDLFKNMFLMKAEKYFTLKNAREEISKELSNKGEYIHQLYLILDENFHKVESFSHYTRSFDSPENLNDALQFLNQDNGLDSHWFPAIIHGEACNV